MARPVRGADGARGRLLDAAWRLLLEGESGRTPTTALVCAAASCTAPTLYHHFGSFDGLLAAACDREFGWWADGVEAAVDSALDPAADPVVDSAADSVEPTVDGDAGGSGPAARLRRRGRAYLDWALGHPRGYRVLFLTPRAVAEHEPPTSARGYRELLTDVAALTGHAPEDPAAHVQALAFWSAVHGLAALVVTGTPPLPRELVDTTYDVLAAALIGAARPAAGGMP